MTNTTFLELKKPDGTDPIDISVLNDNSDTIDSAFSDISTLHKAVTLESNADLDNLYVSQSPSNVDCVVRKWVIPSAAVGETLRNLPLSFKTVYPNAEIEWHTVKNNGVGYQILTGGTNSSFQRFMRFRTANGWGSWYTIFDTDNDRRR